MDEQAAAADAAFNRAMDEAPDDLEELEAAEFIMDSLEAAQAIADAGGF